MFKSNGVATEDIAVAGRIYEIAKERKWGGGPDVGKEVRRGRRGVSSSGAPQSLFQSEVKALA